MFCKLTLQQTVTRSLTLLSHSVALSLILQESPRCVLAGSVFPLSRSEMLNVVLVQEVHIRQVLVDQKRTGLLPNPWRGGGSWSETHPAVSACPSVIESVRMARVSQTVHRSSGRMDYEGARRRSRQPRSRQARWCGRGRRRRRDPFEVRCADI
jgi:hypothetical protein